MKKGTMITYNPFENNVQIMVTANLQNPAWVNLASGSKLLDFTDPEIKVLFSNIAEDIVNIINDELNTSEDGLEIQFYGPDSDYRILEGLIAKANVDHPDQGNLSCVQAGRYFSADESVQIVKNAYNRISNEFYDYLPGNKNYDDALDSIGNRIVSFNEIISNEIPICIIGNYSVGKSAFINALIGSEILPSKVDPSTAKNVKVVRSFDGRYYIKLHYRSEEADAQSTIEYEVINHSLRLISAGGPEGDVAKALMNEIITAISNTKEYPKALAERSQSEIMHDILDVMNDTENQGLLANVKWNLIITVPFVESALTKTNSTIVFFDTPGSNNATLNQAEHKQALEELMTAQTNALPILMTTKDNAASNDVSEIKSLLDEYSHNFSSPNCLVVIAKADLLYSGQLNEDIPAPITDWHGRSPVLYTTQVGAIGNRKTEKDRWIDAVYQEAYKAWTYKFDNNPDVYTLPEYNVVPCQGRNIIDAKSISSPELYATGIPSVECEILYYIDHYANYKKAIRGKESLIDALDGIQKELDRKHIEYTEACEEAKKRKEDEKYRLIDELVDIRIPSLLDDADTIVARFAEKLDEYCSRLPETMETVYAKVSAVKPLEMDKQFNDVLRLHCQKNLIDACYYGENGIQSMILSNVQTYADEYKKALSKFVTDNSSVLSKESKESMENYLNTEIKPPEFDDVKSILDSFNEWLDKTALIQYGFLSMTKDTEKAKKKWLENKRSQFERRLRDGKNLLNQISYGLFMRAAVIEPLSEYAKQLDMWADHYYMDIRDSLDQDNAVLSGMEEDIKKINDSIQDISDRLERVEASRMQLSKLMNLMKKTA